MYRALLTLMILTLSVAPAEAQTKANDGFLEVYAVSAPDQPDLNGAEVAVYMGPVVWVQKTDSTDFGLYGLEDKTRPLAESIMREHRRAGECRVVDVIEVDVPIELERHEKALELLAYCEANVVTSVYGTDIIRSTVPPPRK